MANVTKPAEIFLNDVKDSLGERHEVGRETEEGGDGRIEDISGIQIKSVDGEFHDIEGSWEKRSAGFLGEVIGWVLTLSVGEAVTVLQSLHAIDLLRRIKVSASRCAVTV